MEHTFFTWRMIWLIIVTGTYSWNFHAFSENITLCRNITILLIAKYYEIITDYVMVKKYNYHKYRFKAFCWLDMYNCNFICTSIYVNISFHCVKARCWFQVDFTSVYWIIPVHAMRVVPICITCHYIVGVTW